MKLLIIMLLATSCASELKFYSTQTGVKCTNEYYYSLRYNKCTNVPSVIVSRTLTSTYKASPDVEIGLSDYKVILRNINKCSQ